MESREGQERYQVIASLGPKVWVNEWFDDLDQATAKVDSTASEFIDLGETGWSARVHDTHTPIQLPNNKTANIGKVIHHKEG